MQAQILLVDDDASLLRLISIRLNSAGYRVIAADSGEQALAMLTVECPHLVITDLRMPGMDGMALFEAIHEHSPALPVMILTAHGNIPEAVAATKRGVFSFLTKPFDSKELLEHVEKALALSAPPSHREEGEEDDWRKDIISRSLVMQTVLSQARMIAESDANVLILGESGTGKELLAKAIHQASTRRNKPFMAINCGAIPEPLLESELFGHSKGAFSGAIANYKGLFQAAHSGTLFLDEVGDMPLALQVKLLRVLQEKIVRPVGAVESVAVDVRIISATHRNLEIEMAAGNFREDLYYRLKVIALEIPTLAERREDIPLLVAHFLVVVCKKNKKRVTGFASEAMELLLAASWPGNVRQLYNVVEQAVVLCATPIIPASLVQKALQEEPCKIPSLIEARHRFEREYLAQVLKMSNGNVSHAAQLAQRNRTDFYKLLRRYHLEPSMFKASL